MIFSGGDVFELPENWSEPFEKPIPCQIRTETLQQEEQTLGVVTITPKETGSGILSDRPETLKMTEEDFDQLVPVDTEHLGFQLDPGIFRWGTHWYRYRYRSRIFPAMQSVSGSGRCLGW